MQVQILELVTTFRCLSNDIRAVFTRKCHGNDSRTAYATVALRFKVAPGSTRCLFALAVGDSLNVEEIFQRFHGHTRTNCHISDSTVAPALIQQVDMPV
jgi:hypothetical protein